MAGAASRLVDLAHLALEDVPLALAELHAAIAVGEAVVLRVPAGDRDRTQAVVEAGGLAIERTSTAADGRIEIDAASVRALPDHVVPRMRLLCVGLNPSLHAADAGVGYVTPGNRFWPALASAGLSDLDRDPIALARRDRIGMTDLVKRPTARADELRPDEYRTGLGRLAALCAWLEPAAVAMVGLAGWRAAVSRRAVAGWQPQLVGPSPVYVLPSTSGLNAGTSLAQLADHLRAAAAGPPTT